MKRMTPPLFYWRITRMMHGDDINRNVAIGHVICRAAGREEAKKIARTWLMGDADQYICEPLTRPDEPVMVILSTGTE